MESFMTLCLLLRLGDLLTQSRPARDGIRGANDMHAGLSETAKRGIRMLRIVDNTGDNDRRSAILKQVDLAREPFITLADSIKKVLNRPRDAMTLRLSSNNESIKRQKLFDEVLVFPCDLAPIGIGGDFRSQNGIVLGRGIVSFLSLIHISEPTRLLSISYAV